MSLPAAAPAPIIHLDAFEGPLDLLLSLVERRRLPIAEMSLAAVADQYLAQVRQLDRIDLDILSGFLSMAARLLLLKSRSLLPAIEPPAPPEEDPTESAAELVRRLEAYRIVKDLAAGLRDRDAADVQAFTRGALRVEVDAEVAALQAIAPSLLASLMSAIELRGQRDDPADVPDRPRATVAERLVLLRDRLLHARRFSWDDVAGETVDQIVATLLAVLELVRRGEVQVAQADLFGPIQLEALDRPAGAAPTPDDVLDYAGE